MASEPIGILDQENDTKPHFAGSAQRGDFGKKTFIHVDDWGEKL